MSIASELTNLENNIGDAYDAVNDMSGIIPQHKNMDNLDQAIRTIPQNTMTPLDVYPVGSIYMSVNNTNPGTLFGGTWVAWGAGRVPVGVDANDSSFDTVEETGGEKTHQLTVAEMPSHTHPIYFVDTTSGSQDRQNGLYYNGGWWGNSQGAPNVANTGGNGAHNNLQPYITCYMWKRTA